MSELKMWESEERRSEFDLEESRREQEAYQWGAARYIPGSGRGRSPPICRSTGHS
jgi:hypothetical protein